MARSVFCTIKEFLSGSDKNKETGGSPERVRQYRDVYDNWLKNPEAFWVEEAKQIDWFRFPQKALEQSGAPIYRWFPDALCNTCWNAVDRHVHNGRGKQTALIYDSPVTNTKQKMTYCELLSKVSKLAGALQARGIEKGDRVIIYMPMIPEAIIAMLACARIGAVHSVVFGGFAAKELAVRIDDAKPKAVLSASCGIEPSGVIKYKPLLDNAIELATHKPELCVIKQREQANASLLEGRDVDWDAFQEDAEKADCAQLKGTDPLYILYTSGTTGQPKGIVRDNAGHMVALQWTMKNIYGVMPGDVYWAASDVGWVVGHSYITYAPLIHGCTTVIFEGKPVGTPDAGVFWRIIEEYQVKVLFTAPTAFRAIKREDSTGQFVKKYNLDSLQALFLAGERADPDTIEWAAEQLKVPVIDHWWQTETGWTIAGNPVGVELLPVKLGSSTVPMPGYDVKILDDTGQPVKTGELGAITIKLPLPPGTFPTLWNAEDRFKQTYMETFPGYYQTGDAGYIDQDGYIFIMSRTDDVINVAGHRLSTGAMEEVLASHPDVAECAVIGISDKLKGQLPLGLLCLNANSTKDHEVLKQEIVQLVRNEIGPVAAFKLVTVVKRLPKTRSGKILRGVMTKIADGNEWNIPATIDDPIILEEVSGAFKELGYPVKSVLENETD